MMTPETIEDFIPVGELPQMCELHIPLDQPATIVARFDAVRELLLNSPPPKRPNRSQPIHESLQSELDAWGYLSTEASDGIWE